MGKENFFGIFLVLILFNYVLFHFRNLSHHRFFQPIPSGRRLSLFFLFTIVGLVGLQQGDYFGYAEEIKEIASTPASYGRVTHLEIQYEQLARLVHGNYLIWRFIIFGGQFAILLYYLRKIDLYSNGFLYIFSAVCLHSMVVGRTTWGIVLFFCATYYAIKSKDYKHLLIATLCVFSHTSLIVLLAILPLIFFKLNKKSMILFVILYFVFSYALFYAFENIPMLAAFEQTEVLSQKMESYSDPNRENSIGFFGNSIGAKLSTIPQKLGLLGLLVILLYNGYKKRNSIEHGIQYLLLASLFLVMFSFVMLKGNFGAGTLSYRFFDMIQLPLSFAFYYFYKNRFIAERTFRLFMIIFIFSLEISLIVPLYYSSL